MRADYLRVLRRGRVLRAGGWSLSYVCRKKTARLAVIVGKKRARSAVVRNRLRRQLREGFRQHWRLELPPADFILRAVCAACANNAPANCQKLLADAAAQIAKSAKSAKPTK